MHDEDQTMEPYAWSRLVRLVPDVVKFVEAVSVENEVEPRRRIYVCSVDPQLCIDPWF